MMKRFISLVCILLAFSMVITPASAAEAVPYGSSFFHAHNVYLSEGSSTSFQIWFHVFAVNQMQELGADYIYLQRSSDGTNWSTIKTYTSANYPNMIAYNTASHSGYVTYSNRQSGYQYRAYIHLYAKNSAGNIGTYGVYAYF